MSGFFRVDPAVFFVVLRETIESGLVISILLSFTTQLVSSTPAGRPIALSRQSSRASDVGGGGEGPGSAGSLSVSSVPDIEPDETRALLGVTEERQAKNGRELVLGEQGLRLKRQMDLQIWIGVVSGFALSLTIGAVFIFLFYETLAASFTVAEALWEGTFSVLSATIILVTGLSFLSLDRSRIKWRIKLAHAFSEAHDGGQRRGWSKGKWALWSLPFFTILREGLEGVVFMAGVAVSDPKSIPLSALLAIVVGSAASYSLYRSTSSEKVKMHNFVLVSSSLLFFIGAGLFTKGFGRLEAYPFERAVGGDLAESGSGPGSYDVRGNVFHFNWGNPEIKTNGWAMVAQAVCGWNNNGTVGTITAYASYWLAVAGSVVVMKWREGRLGDTPWSAARRAGKGPAFRRTLSESSE